MTPDETTQGKNGNTKNSVSTYRPNRERVIATLKIVLRTLQVPSLPSILAHVFKHYPGIRDKSRFSNP